MTNQLPFTTEEEKEIEEILTEAFGITDEEEQIIFVTNKCANNLHMRERILSDLNENEIRSGEEIISYKILYKIDRESGFANIYLAEHKISGKLVVIKIFNKKKDSDNSPFKFNEYCWENERKSLDNFDRNDIVKLLEVGIHEEYGHYLIIEYVMGSIHIDYYCEGRKSDKDNIESIKHNIESIFDLLNLFIKLCDVVGYVHSKEIAHLDLKPDNILMTFSSQKIKLIDFNSSKKIKERLKPKISDLFKPHSRYYASPEQFNSYEDLDHLSDIYSLGAVFYKLLTGKVPFGEEENDKDQVKLQVLNSELIDPSQRVLDLREKKRFGVSAEELSEMLKGDLDSIIGKCLQRNKDSRYQSTTAIKEDIENYLNGRIVNARLQKFTSLKDKFKYKSSKFFTNFLTIKEGVTGWKKWKEPTLKLALTSSFIFLLMFFCLYSGRYILRQIKGELNPSFVELKSKPYRVRTGDEVKDDYPVQNVLTLVFDEKSYFNFVKLPEKSIYMGRFEITNTQWNLVTRMTKIDIDLTKKTDDNSLPKTEISYKEAVEFCKRLSKHLDQKFGSVFNFILPKNSKTKFNVRLPKETEWEYACLAGTGTKYGGGADFDADFVNSKYPINQLDNFQKFVVKKLSAETKPDSNFDSNPWGLAAMNGNVWEMVSESLEDNEYRLRGGSFAFIDAQCATFAIPNINSPGNNQMGFRIVIEEEAVKKIISPEVASK